MKQAFIDKISKGAIEGYHEYGVLPSLIMAQAILESGWGRSDLSKKSNNLFGVKADASWLGEKVISPTKEYIKGKWINVDAHFRKYDSFNESILDHAKFLNKPRYNKVRDVKDYEKACREVYKAGYATDPNYPSKLIQIIEQNKLYEYDLMEKEVQHHWAESDFQELLKNGIEVNDRRFDDNITRGEVISLINRVVKKLQH